VRRCCPGVVLVAWMLRAGGGCIGVCGEQPLHPVAARVESRRCADCTTSWPRAATAAPRDPADPRARRRVRRLHPALTIFMIGPPHRGETRPAGRGRATRNGHAGLIEVVAGQAGVQVPALGAPVGALDPRRDDVRVAGPDDSPGFQPRQASDPPSYGSGLVRAGAGGGFAERAVRWGYRSTGRSPVPRASAWRRGWGCRRGGGCGRFLPGRVPPPKACRCGGR
jgi:hypothetical protein